MADLFAAYITIGGPIPENLVEPLCKAIQCHTLYCDSREVPSALPAPRICCEHEPTSIRPTCCNSFTTRPLGESSLSWRSFLLSMALALIALTAPASM